MEKVIICIINWIGIFLLTVYLMENFKNIRIEYTKK